MPEIWLRYGTTDIVLDIKLENLYKEIKSQFSIMAQEKIAMSLQNITLKDNTLIIVLSGSQAINNVLSTLIKMAYNKGLRGLSIGILPKFYQLFELKNNPYAVFLLNLKEYSFLNDIMDKFEMTIFLSHTSYDPLFGFSGIPTSLVRFFMNARMSEAFSSRPNDLPNAGIITEPYKLAISACQNINAISIEIVANENGISAIHYGSIEEAFSQATSELASYSIVEEPVRSAIISAGSELTAHLTLGDSLNSLWNSGHIVKKNGCVVLLAEDSGGIGSQALQMFIEGRLNLNDLKQNTEYIEGQEHITFIGSMAQKYELGIVSTLPRYYLNTRLGFKTYSGLKEVVENLISKHGKFYKVLVLSDADVTLVKPK